MFDSWRIWGACLRETCLSWEIWVLIVQFPILWAFRDSFNVWIWVYYYLTLWNPCGQGVAHRNTHHFLVRVLYRVCCLTLTKSSKNHQAWSWCFAWEEDRVGRELWWLPKQRGHSHFFSFCFCVLKLFFCHVETLPDILTWASLSVGSQWGHIYTSTRGPVKK